jgi:hypothetical protein
MGDGQWVDAPVGTEQQAPVQIDFGALAASLWVSTMFVCVTAIIVALLLR